MSEMTISQALRRVKKLKGEIAQHLERAASSVAYDVKAAPAFNFDKCIEAADAAREELVRLESGIAVANATTTIMDGGKPVLLVTAVKALQELKGQVAWFKALQVKAKEKTVVEEMETTWVGGDYKSVKTERHFHCDLPEWEKSELQNEFQDRFDRLNDAVETANHRTALAVP